MSSIDTTLIHGTSFKESTPIVPSIVTASTFVQPSLTEPTEFSYGRCQNPTRQAYENLLAAIEGGTAAFASASGSAATTQAIQLLPVNSHIIAHRNVYAGTKRIFRFYEEHANFTVTYVDTNNVAEILQACQPNTHMVWLESMANPFLEVMDLTTIITTLKGHEATKDILIAVDNTIATAWNITPLTLGADLSVFSTGKHINGHADVTGGAVVVKDAALAKKLYHIEKALGAVANPFDAYLALRGVKTLALRLQHQCATALYLAEHLQHNKHIKAVYYPFLPNHKNYQVARNLLKTGGPLLTIQINDNLVHNFLKNLKYFLLAESFGSIESIVNHTATMSHDHLSLAEQQAENITFGTLRLSPGIEDMQDLLMDIEQALEKSYENII